MAPMKDEDLDSIIEQARNRRSSQHSGVQPDADQMWRRIHTERGRQRARHTMLRRAAGVLAASVIVVAGFVTWSKFGGERYGETQLGGTGQLTTRSGQPFTRVNLVPAHAEPNFGLRTAVSATQLGAVEVSALLAGDAGTIYAADRRSGRVVAFDSSGKLALSIGRRGTVRSGAAEAFSSIDALAWLADTMVVTDNGSGEFVFFSRLGELIESKP
jgi:hypothetical protein